MGLPNYDISPPRLAQNGKIYYLFIVLQKELKNNILIKEKLFNVNKVPFIVNTEMHNMSENFNENELFTMYTELNECNLEKFSNIFIGVFRNEFINNLSDILKNNRQENSFKKSWCE